MSENTETTTEKIAESNGFEKLKEGVVTFLEFVFKVGLAVGSIIAFCFYFWYVEVMPSMGNIGDITIFLVMVAIVGILIALFVLLLLPALWWNDKEYKVYLEKKVHRCFPIKATWLFFGLVSIINSAWMLLFAKSDLTHNIVIWWLICLVLPSLMLFATLIYRHNKMINLIYFIVISFFYSLLISGYALVSLDNFRGSIGLIIYSIIFIVVMGGVNILMSEAILKKFKSETSQQNQHFYRWFPIACIFFVIYFLSQVLISQHKEVFFITKPFELLKLGHYKATLQFKEDFIQKDNPFSKSNLNNCKEGYFFIRSSIGDEYILQEFEERKENNTTKKEPLKRKPDVYRIKKEFVLAESSDTNTTNINKTWAIDNGCDSYEKVTFKKEFIKNNNPFIENANGCLTKTFWVRDRGATLELKDRKDTNDTEPYQISSLYIMSRQKMTDQNTTWMNCPPKISHQSKDDK